MDVIEEVTVVDVVAGTVVETVVVVVTATVEVSVRTIVVGASVVVEGPIPAHEQREEYREALLPQEVVT